MNNLQKLIKKLKLTYVNPNIENAGFADKLRNKNFKVFHFNRYISSEDAIQEIEKKGYQPANAIELLTWAKDWNSKDWVVALGEIRHVGGDRHVLYLWFDGLKRDLSLCWFGYGWSGHCRFLAVRKSSAKTLGSSDLDSLTLRISVLESKLTKISELLKQ